MKSSIAAVSLVAAVASARQCKNLTIPISASARNGVFSLDPPVTDIDVTNFILNLGQQGSNYTEEVLQSYTKFSGDYEIAATYCQPDSGASSVIQILTHGIGFDRSYWDVPFNNYNYSYVAEAVDQYGFSTFTWDRLGVGISSLGDPLINLFFDTGARDFVGELLTIGGETGSINNYAGPVHIVTGGRDVPYCGGDCYAAPTGYENIPSQSRNYLPNAQNFQVDIIGDSGHGLNLEYDYPTTYATMLNYLVQNGLGPQVGACGSGQSGKGGKRGQGGRRGRYHG